jgi:hypothetical protein
MDGPVESMSPRVEFITSSTGPEVCVFAMLTLLYSLLVMDSSGSMR